MRNRFVSSRFRNRKAVALRSARTAGAETKEDAMGSKLNDLFAFLFTKDSRSQVKRLEEDRNFSPARAELAAQIGLSRLPIA